jgi:hypothetical protein
MVQMMEILTDGIAFADVIRTKCLVVSFAKELEVKLGMTTIQQFT